MNELLVSEIKISYEPRVKASECPKVTCSQDAYEQIKQFFDPSLMNVKEEAVVLYLNCSNRIMGGFKVSSGGISCTIVDITLILGVAVKCLARGLVLAHTHPSGELQPSKADLNLTARLKEAARLLDIRLIEHLILSTDGYLIFADEGLL